MYINTIILCDFANDKRHTPVFFFHQAEYVLLLYDVVVVPMT